MLRKALSVLTLSALSACAPHREAPNQGYPVNRVRSGVTMKALDIAHSSPLCDRDDVHVGTWHLPQYHLNVVSLEDSLGSRLAASRCARGVQRQLEEPTRLVKGEDSRGRATWEIFPK